MAILIGTDFNNGVKGIGPKKGLQAIKKNGNIENALATIGADDAPTFSEIKEIRDIFLHPAVTDEYTLSWSPPDTKAVEQILCDKHQFTQERVEPLFQKFEPLETMVKQKNLMDF